MRQGAAGWLARRHLDVALAHCLTGNVTEQVLASDWPVSPSRIGVAQNGEKNQHGRTARVGVGGGKALSVGQAGGKGAHP
jgi:hypothetical protein